MADKSRIRVAVLEGDYANLCGLGLPLSLSLTLQIRNLQLSGALWTGKTSASGFSISLYWPTTGTVPEKEKAKKTRRRQCKCKHKVIPRVSTGETTPELAKSIKCVQVNFPINEHSSPKSI